MYQYVLFDLDDTVLDFQKGEVEGIKIILSKYGVKDLKAGLTVYSEINTNIWKQIEQGGNKGELLSQRFTETFDHFGIKVNGAALNAEYLDIISNNFYVLSGAKELLNNLKNAGIILIAATNGIKRNQEKRLIGTGLTQLFDATFISEDIGYSKPDARFYNPIFKHYPLMDHTNVVMVGDGLSSDMQGAINAKIDSIWFNPKHNDTPNGIKPTFVAHSFNDVKTLVLNQSN